MYQISTLFENFPIVSHSRMVNRGFGVWLVWGDTLEESVVRSLKDFGGMLMSEGQNQAYWFFFSDDVFRVSARLEIWARLNPMPVFMQIMPATLLVDYNLGLSLKVADEFTSQEVALPKEFEVILHPQHSDALKRIAGLNVENIRTPTGISKSGWLSLVPDQGLAYDSMQSWYFIMIPVGNPSDKNFIRGWRAFFSDIQVLLQKLGVHYITSDVKVIMPIGTLSLLRTFLRELLGLITTLKNNEGEESSYWPSVMALVPQMDMGFNDEIIRKVNLDWDKLSPDCPHLRYRDAFLLGGDFALNEVRFGSEQETVEGWCHVSLKQGIQDVSSGAVEVTISRRVSVGENEDCFYCGMKNHTPDQCPSKNLKGMDLKPWKHLAAIDKDKFNEGFQGIDLMMQDKDVVDEFSKLVLSGKGYEGILIKALFSINAVSQLRVLYMLLRSRGTEWPKGIHDQGPEEGELIWEAFDALVAGAYSDSEMLIKNAMIRFSRSFQPRALMGFWELENGNREQAYFYWQEAERLCFSPLQQGYFIYLQGRAQEVSGEFGDASSTFRRAGRLCPDWLEPLYRRAICMVKMGFAEQAIPYFEEVIERDPNYFNRAAIDPELDRGRLTVMQDLGILWGQAEAEAKEVASGMDSLSSDIGQWFIEGHEFADEAAKFMDRMNRLAKIKNYVAFRHLTSGIARLTKEIEKRVEYEIKVINKRLEYFREELLDIQREASWFPFPKLLTEFNNDFNYCADKIYWIKTQNLNQAETFRKTQEYLNNIDDRLKKLKHRLVTLRVIRDSTLFVMLLGRSFIWLEVIFLGLALMCIPAVIYYSNNFPPNFVIEMIVRQKWEFQQGMILILSILALAISAFRAAVVFEKKKRELFLLDDDDGGDKK